MHILLIHPNPLTDYHLERLVSESLEELQHTVTQIKYRGEPSKTVSQLLKKESVKADFALILKGESLTEENYAEIECPSALWYVDHPKDDILPDWLLRGITNVDFVFVSSYGLLEKIKSYNEKCYWLVEGAHLPLLQPQKQEKQYDLSFFGTLIAETNNGDVFGTRADWLKKIDEKYDFHLFGCDSNQQVEGYQFKQTYSEMWNQDLVEHIAKSKIVLSYNSTNQVELYWSNRIYVTLACQGFLITPYVPGLEKVFENHKELVWYRSEEEFHEFVEYYLQRPEQREQIAEKGYHKIVALFSTKKQIEKLTQIIKEKCTQLGKKQRLLLLTDVGFVGCRSSSNQWSMFLKQQGFFVEEFFIEETVPEHLATKYDLIVLNGYSGKYENLLNSNTRKAVVWHSSLLQSQLEKEAKQIRKVKELQSNNNIELVFCTDRNCLKLFQQAVWLPNIYVVEPRFSEKQFVDKTKINISALGPAKDRKNLFTVLQAVSSLNDNYRVHINVSEDYYDQNIKGLFCEEKIVNHGWLNKEDYFALIKQCTLGVQLSVGESYNFVAADHLALGVPVICSSSIIAIPSEELHIKNSENSGELIAKMDEVRRLEKDRKQIWMEDFYKDNERRKKKVDFVFKQLFNIEYSVPACNIKTHRPILSIVYHGRNDNYAGNFKRRLCWSLSTIQKAFKDLNPEILFVCWNTLPQTKKIFDDSIFADCRSRVKYYEVASNVHDALAKKFNYEGVYLEWFAKNFGIRRAQGEFILQLNSDNLIVNPISIGDLPRIDQSYVAVRTEVEASILNKNPFELTEESLQEHRGGEWIPDIERPHYVGGSCGEFILAHRNLWNEICGNVETADRYCIDNVTATHLREVSNLTIFKHKVYHIAHPSSSGSWPGFDFPVGYSGPNWGLPNIFVEPYSYE